MIANILLVGIALIVVLGSVILLDRERANTKPRAQYRIACAAGMAVMALTVFGIL